MAGWGNDSTRGSESDSIDVSATGEFRFDQVVTRGDTKVSRSVEWSFECSGTTGDVCTQDVRTNDDAPAHRACEHSTTSDDVKRFVSDGG